jgi:hypothetical protein
MLNLNEILEKMWNDYCAFNPQAQRIYNLFTEQGETVINDHIALRIFKWKNLGLESLAKTFRGLGYQEGGEYHFREKKLLAKHFEHPNPDMPKIFISELLVDQLSPTAQSIISKLVDQLTPEFLSRPDMAWAGRPWRISSTDYLTLASESEYASWVAAHGFRPNHFTVSVNALKKFDSIEKVNQFLLDHNIKLNTSGGLVKGTPEELLEQSSTMAEKVRVDFEDKSLEVPACYYEFAKRYPLPDGKLYQGFIAKSADKIFESTNANG